MSYVALPPSDSVPLPADPDSSKPVEGNTETSSPSEKEKPSSKAPPPPERQWAYISDTVVRLTTKEEVLKAKAYLCLYERV